MVRENWDRFSERTSRVEARLNDERFGTEDRRGLREARFIGPQLIAVTHQTATLGQAVDLDAEKLKRYLDGALGQLGYRQWTTRPAEGAGPSEYPSRARFIRR